MPDDIIDHSVKVTPIGCNTPEHAGLNSPCDGSTGKIQDFIFARELSEVYLLMDNVSTRSDKALGSADRATGGDLAAIPNWIKEVCKIGWPPTGTTLQLADQAATLLTVRDRLNILAAPANGATIAFTLLVSGEDSEAHLGSLFGGEDARGHSLLSTLAGDGHGKSRPSTGRTATTRAKWATNAPSRQSLASLAFPGLIRHAADFRLWMRWVVFGLFIWLIVTCLLSWNVAVGSALLGRLNTISAQREDIAKQISDAQAGEVHPSAAPAEAAVGAVAAPAGDQKPVYRYCDRPRLLAPEVSAANVRLERFDNVTEMHLCDQKRLADRQYRIAEAGTTEWLGLWRRFLPIPASLPMLATEAATATTPEAARRGSEDATAANDVQWATILIGVLASAVLPVAYGILGAGAAVLRGLSRKMKDSLLSPRDLQLSLVQLALGAVIGACIGLFVTPSGNTSPSGQSLLGSVPLTASALCFIAGFGVEGVFVALEALLSRVFNIADPSKRPS